MPRVAFRAVRSRSRFLDIKEVRQYMEDFLEGDVKPHLIKAHERIVADWDHKPDFKGRKYVDADSLRITVHPDGPNKDIWKWVTGGTRPHVIEAKNAPFLVFATGYIPHTKPGGIYGGPGRAYGDIRRKERVDHPGTKPRRFEKHIASWFDSWFKRMGERAWRRAIYKVQ